MLSWLSDYGKKHGIARLRSEMRVFMQLYFPTLPRTSLKL